MNLSRISTLLPALALTTTLHAADKLDHESTQKEDLELARSGKLKVGDRAPDFELTPLERSNATPKKKFSSLLKKRPMVLIFGSYTCNLTRRAVPNLEKTYAQYKDQAEFCFVYMKEAHPKSKKKVLNKKEQPVSLAQPKTESERLALARYLLETHPISLPFYVDNMQGQARKAYTAYHLAAYVVGSDGKLAMVAPYKYSTGKIAKVLRGMLPTDAESSKSADSAKSEGSSKRGKTRKKGPREGS